MGFHLAMVIIFASVMAIFFGLLTDEAFIRRTKNNRPYLTWLGIAFFGKNKGKYSEFITSEKAVVITIFDIIFGLLLGGVVYWFVTFLIEKTFVFYIPLSTIIINSIVLIIRKKFDKIKIWGWILFSIFYALAITLIILIIKFNWFGYA